MGVSCYIVTMIHPRRSRRVGCSKHVRIQEGRRGAATADGASHRRIWLPWPASGPSTRASTVLFNRCDCEPQFRELQRQHETYII
eukprot:UN02752